MYQRHPTHFWQSTGGCAGFTQHLEIKRNHQLNKVELYKVLILSILRFGAETWTLKKVDANRLQTFEMMYLRKIQGVIRLDKIRNTSIRQTLGIKNTITELVANKRLRNFGDVKRMSSTRNPNLVLGSHIHGNIPRGRPSKRWEDCVRSDCQERGLRPLKDAYRLCKTGRLGETSNTSIFNGYEYMKCPVGTSTFHTKYCVQALPCFHCYC